MKPTGLKRRVTNIAFTSLLWLSAATAAIAQTTIDAPGTVLLFPVVDTIGHNSSRFDTLITIANVSNNEVHARCFYLDHNECSVQSEFQITLTQQQPTQWSALRGRPDDPADPLCSNESSSCPNAGYDPGEIPPMFDFIGVLLCIQTDDAGILLGANQLVGSATLSGPNRGDSGHYEAVRLQANDVEYDEGPICEGDQVEAGCSTGGHVTACPAKWQLTAPADVPGEAELLTASTEIVVAPCALDLSSATDGLSLELAAVNELEQHFSVTVGGGCVTQLTPANYGLTAEALGTPFVELHVRSLDSERGIVAVARGQRHIYENEPWVSAEIDNLHQSEFIIAGKDRIVLPTDAGVMP